MAEAAPVDADGVLASVSPAEVERIVDEARPRSWTIGPRRYLVLVPPLLVLVLARAYFLLIVVVCLSALIRISLLGRTYLLRRTPSDWVTVPGAYFGDHRPRRNYPGHLVVGDDLSWAPIVPKVRASRPQASRAFRLERGAIRGIDFRPTRHPNGPGTLLITTDAGVLVLGVPFNRGLVAHISSTLGLPEPTAH